MPWKHEDLCLIPEARWEKKGSGMMVHSCYPGVGELDPWGLADQLLSSRWQASSKGPSRENDFFLAKRMKSLAMMDTSQFSWAGLRTFPQEGRLTLNCTKEMVSIIIPSFNEIICFPCQISTPSRLQDHSHVPL